MLDIEQFCKRHSIPYCSSGHHHCHQGWVQLNCPICSPHGGWHLGFSLEQGNFNCWRCGGLPFWRAVGLLLRSNAVDDIKRAVAESQQDGAKGSARKRIARKRAVKPPPGLGPMIGAHRKYLAGRGFDPAAIEAEWGVQGTRHLSNDWSWRLIVPIRNGEGEVVAYQGRALGDVKPKYRMTPNEDMPVDPKTLLYGLDKAYGDRVVVVEGVPSVWRLGPGTVATLGIDWREPQACILRHYRHRFILFDPEPKAQQQAEKLAKWLSMYPGTTEVVSGFRSDPGDFSPRLASRVMRELGLTQR